MNLLVSNQTDFEFYNNSYASYGGMTYQDVAIFEYYVGGYVYGFMGGHDVVFNANYTDVLSGTATGYLEQIWNGSNWIPLWLVDGFSYSASAIADAIFTPSQSDDFLIISNILSGNDNVIMSNYSDKVRGYGGNDNIHGNGGNDILYGDAGADRLYGQGGKDTLSGGSGNDLLVGGTGKDVMNGGTGSDRFDFNAVNESVITSIRDVINGFDAYDVIDVSSIDAKTTVAGNQAFTFSRGADFSGTFNGTGKLFYETDTHILWGNNDGDAQADFSIKVNLSGISNLTAADFVLKLKIT